MYRSTKSVLRVCTNPSTRKKSTRIHPLQTRISIRRCDNIFFTGPIETRIYFAHRLSERFTSRSWRQLFLGGGKNKVSPRGSFQPFSKDAKKIILFRTKNKKDQEGFQLFSKDAKKMVFCFGNKLRISQGTFCTFSKDAKKQSSFGHKLRMCQARGCFSPFLTTQKKKKRNPLAQI